MKESGTISPLKAILAVAASYVLFLFLEVAFIILFGINFAIMFSELLLIVVPLGYMLYKRINVRSYVGLDLKPQNILLGFVSGIFIFFFSMLVSVVLVLIFGPSEAVEESNNFVINISGSPAGLLSAIIGLSMAGICEEFTFRGFLLTAINSKYSFGTALLVSSLAFGILHFDLQAVYTISAFVVGLLFGYVYHRWHSYVVSAVAHSTSNLVTLAILLLIR